jgi:hypothetical protein
MSPEDGGEEDVGDRIKRRSESNGLVENSRRGGWRTEEVDRQ